VLARVVIAGALAGCNTLLGAGEPSLLVDADPGVPSCATGWHSRIPIAIDNPSGRELRDYQLAIPIDRVAREAQLRFAAAGEGPLPHAIEGDLVWVSVPVIPPGASEIDAFFENANAPAWDASPFEPVIANGSFEGNGGWTAEPPQGPAASFDLASPKWATDGVGSLAIDYEVFGERGFTSRAAISQPVTFPEGTEHVIRFDLDVVAASNGGVNGTCDGTFEMILGHGIVPLWVLTGNAGNITGVRLAQETTPFGGGPSTLTIGVRIEGGGGPGYTKGFVDHLRVRKHVTPEPTVQVGSARPCD
jgi:hypothetical protein